RHHRSVGRSCLGFRKALLSETNLSGTGLSSSGLRKILRLRKIIYLHFKLKHEMLNCTIYFIFFVI
ncbi:Uncharacterized protein APZ42_003274, partial [Daphnia magna]